MGSEERRQVSGTCHFASLRTPHSSLRSCSVRPPPLPSDLHETPRAAAARRPAPRARRSSAVVAGVPRPPRRPGLDDARPVRARTMPPTACSTTSRSCPAGTRCTCITASRRAFVPRSRHAVLLRPGLPGRLSQDAGLRRRQPAGRDAAGPGGRTLPAGGLQARRGRPVSAGAVRVRRGGARGGAEPLPGLPGLRPGDAGVVGQAVPRPAGGRRRGSAAGVAGRAGADRAAAPLPPCAGPAQPGRRGADGVRSAGSPTRCSWSCRRRCSWSTTSPSAPATACSGTSAWPAAWRRACWPTSSGCWTGSITGGFARRSTWKCRC